MPRGYPNKKPAGLTTPAAQALQEAKTKVQAAQKIDNQPALVTTGIKVNGEEHLFETLEKTGELPIIKSIGFARISATKRDYISYVITSRGREVLNIEVTEPNIRAIAMDEAKIAFVMNFENGEEVILDTMVQDSAPKAVTP